MSDVPSPEGKEVGDIRRTEQVIDFKLRFPSFSTKGHAKQDLIMLVAFLVTLGL